MKTLLSAVVAASILLTAAASVRADNAQQERMKQCNAQASDKKLSGDSRKTFMQSCLSGGSGSGANSQQEKMKKCNAAAGQKQLKGDERKSFMKNCLSAGSGS